MKSVIFLILVLILILILAACAKPAIRDRIPASPESPQTVPPVEPTEPPTGKLVSFSFTTLNFSVWNGDMEYTLTANSDAVHMSVNDDSCTVNTSVMEEVETLVRNHRLDLWDGFNESDSMVLDGYGFSMHLLYDDGTEINARGSNAYPRGFGAAEDEIVALFDTHMVYPVHEHKLSDALCGVHVTFHSEDGGQFNFGADIIYNEPGVDDEIELSIFIEDFEEFGEDFTYYGTCEMFPLWEFQNILRENEVWKWHGWDETLDAPQEWFQFAFYYEDADDISAMGSDFPEGYADVREAILTLLMDYIKENREAFESH